MSIANNEKSFRFWEEAEGVMDTRLEGIPSMCFVCRAGEKCESGSSGGMNEEVAAWMGALAEKLEGEGRLTDNGQAARITAAKFFFSNSPVAGRYLGRASFKPDHELWKNLHLFHEALLNVLDCIRGDFFVRVRPSRDANGFHWTGVRIEIQLRNCESSLYIHTGVIYLPHTRMGFMVEVDKANNKELFDILKNNISEGKDYDYILENQEYIKLFMPDPKWEALIGCDANQQYRKLEAFFISCFRAFENAILRSGK